MEDDLLAAMMDFEEPAPQQAPRAAATPAAAAMSPSPLAPSPLPGGLAPQHVTAQHAQAAEQHYDRMAGVLNRSLQPDKQQELRTLFQSYKAQYGAAATPLEKYQLVLQFKAGLRRISGDRIYEQAKQALHKQAVAVRASQSPAAVPLPGQPPQHGVAPQQAAARQQAQQQAQHQAQQQALLQQQQQQQALLQQQQAQQRQAAMQQQAQQQALQQQRQAAAAQQVPAAQAQPPARAASPYPNPGNNAAGGMAAGQPAGQAQPGAGSLQQQQQLTAQQQQQMFMAQQQHLMAQQQQAAAAAAAAAGAKKRPAEAGAAGAVGAALGGGGAADGPAAKRAKVGGGGGATLAKAKKDADDVGVTVDNLIDYEGETNQLMEGLQRLRQTDRLRQHTSSNQQFLSEWRIGNELYRHIQRTGGGLKVNGECFELVQLAFQAHMSQVVTRALRNAQHRQDVARRSADVVVTADPRRGVTQIERREKVKADAKAEAERAELLRMAGSKKADEETKERAQKAKAELVGKQQASLANAAVAATLGGKAKGKVNKWDKWSSAATAGPGAADEEAAGGAAAGGKGKKGGKKGAGKKGADGGGSATEGEGGSVPGSDAEKAKAPAATAARGRGLTGTGGATAGSDDASTIHLQDVAAVLERDPMYCRSSMLYRLLNTPRATATGAQ